MAYVPEKKDDQEQSPIGAGTPPGSFGDTTPSSTPTKSNFVNVNDYLSKNPEASGQLGHLAAGKLNQQGTEAQQALSDVQSKFGQAVQSGSTTLDQGLLDRAFSDPTKFASNPNDLAKFTALRDASYKGPTSLESTDYYAPTAAKISALGTSAQSVGNEAGRNALVQGLSSHPTQGKTALSQLLLQGNEGAAKEATDAAGSFKGVEDQWQQFMKSAPSQIEQAKAGTNAARSATQAGLQDATSNFMKQLQDQTAAKSQERDTYNQKVQGVDSALANWSPAPGQPGPLNQQQREFIGVTNPDYYNRLGEASSILKKYGQSAPQFNTYLSGATPIADVPQMGTVASPEQYAKEAALQQMAGYDLGLDNAQAAKAGSYNPTFSNPKFDVNAANGLFGQVNTADKGLVDPWISQNFGYLNESPDKYSKAMQLIMKDPSIEMGGVLGGVSNLSALNRLVNGFGPEQAESPLSPNVSETYVDQNPTSTAPTLPPVENTVPAGTTSTSIINSQPQVNPATAPPPVQYDTTQAAPYPTPTSPKPTSGRWIWDTYAGKWFPLGLV